MIVLPGAGFSVHVVGVGSGTAYVALGPFPPGSVLTRVVGVACLGGDASPQSVTVGVVVGGGGDANAESFAAGAPLMTTGTAVGGQPSFRFQAAAGVLVAPFVLPVWYDVGAGPVFVLVRVGRVAGLGEAGVLVGVESVRVVEG